MSNKNKIFFTLYKKYTKIYVVFLRATYIYLGIFILWQLTVISKLNLYMKLNWEKHIFPVLHCYNIVDYGLSQQHPNILILFF